MNDVKTQPKQPTPAMVLKHTHTILQDMCIVTQRKARSDEINPEIHYSLTKFRDEIGQQILDSTCSLTYPELQTRLLAAFRQSIPAGMHYRLALTPLRDFVRGAVGDLRALDSEEAMADAAKLEKLVPMLSSIDAHLLAHAQRA